MKNRYEIVDDYIVIHVENKKGEKFESYIDVEDFDKLDQYSSWHVAYNPEIDGYYLKTTVYKGFNREKGYSISKTVYAHKLVMGTPDVKTIAVDHINHDTLDNRKRNLVVKDDRENLINRAGKNKNNKSGYRNVFWNTSEEKWIVQLQVEKRKNKVLGRFDDVHEAGRFAAEMRLKYYGEP